jgi:hypothetical protein
LLGEPVDETAAMSSWPIRWARVIRAYAALAEVTAGSVVVLARVAVVTRANSVVLAAKPTGAVSSTSTADSANDPARPTIRPTSR